MARVALERAIEPGWGDEVFEEPRQRQYPRELLLSTVVEWVSLVSLGPRPSLHAAAKQAGHLPVIEPMAGTPSLPASEKRLAPCASTEVLRCQATRWQSTTRTAHRLSTTSASPARVRQCSSVASRC